ncbi:MAG: hypothetical protein Q4C67_09405 [Deinococcus sp.]|nr:hypothetical protein [Deinococcus sp.]
MKPVFLLSLLLPAAPAALIGWQAQRADLGGQVLNPDSGRLKCPAAPTFRQAYPEPTADITGQAINLTTNGWLELDVCGPGTLHIDAEGPLAENEGPRLEVALSSERIFEREIHEPQRLSVAVPRAGHLTVGYFNDFYKSEYRSAGLQGLKLTGEHCDTFELTTPAEGGGNWDKNANLLSFVLGTQATLQPCAAGRLSLKLSGSAAAGEAPLLEFEQRGQELKRVRAQTTAEELTLALSGEPLHIRLLNPYFKELGDRNLYLKHIEFVPGTQN